MSPEQFASPSPALRSVSLVPSWAAEEPERAAEEPERATEEPERAVEEPERAVEEPERVVEEPERVVGPAVTAEQVVVGPWQRKRAWQRVRERGLRAWKVLRRLAIIV